MGIFRRQDMEEEDFTTWAVEKRLDMLSDSVYLYDRNSGEIRIA